jgi:ferrochelatase
MGMTMAGAVPTGVLVLAYGTPETLDDVEPYYTHIRGGRRPTPEAREDLRERYRKVGGRTPLKDLTYAVSQGLQQGLEARAPGRYRVYTGMKHWHPFIGETVPQIAADGVREVIAVVLAPHYSRFSLEGYRKYINQALEQQPEERRFRLHFVESWHEQPQFRSLIAARVREQLALFPPEAAGQVRVVFSAHSLPEKILAAGDPYPQQLRESAAGIAELLGLPQYGFCYQSAGQTGEPWLGPDILEYLEELRGQGVRYALSVPFGFVAEHLEVFWDIDTEAQDKAAELGVTLRRIRMPNADPEFVELIQTVVLGADQ